MSSTSARTGTPSVYFCCVLLCVGLCDLAKATGVALIGDVPSELRQSMPAWIDCVSSDVARFEVTVRQYPPRNLGIPSQHQLGWGLGVGIPVGVASIVGIETSMITEGDKGLGGVFFGVALLGGVLMGGLAGFAAGGGVVALFPPKTQYSYDLDVTSTVSGKSLARRCTWTKTDPSVKLARVVPSLLIGLEKDRAKPTVVVKTESYVTSEESAYVSARVTDDVGVGAVTVEQDGRIVFQQDHESIKSVDFGVVAPLRFGANRIQVVGQDWCGRQARAPELTVTRVRQSEAQHAGVRAGEPPDVAVEAVTLDGNNTVVGGREEGVKVTVTNSGKGIAKWVRVVLEGDEYLTRLWGSEQNLDDLKPGESKTATFSLLMPTDLERRQAKLRVVVKEGRGYSPTEVPELTLNLVPAERTATQVEVVEDVSHGLPDAGNHRSSATALVIGVSSYPSAPLKYARQDADAFRLYASQVLGIPEANTTVLLDEQATGSRIRGRLQDWMKKKTGFKAIFFSGHGTTNPENAKDSIPYLVPHDGDRELKSTLVPTDAIADLCSSDKDTLVVFLDACLSGGDKPLVNQVIPDTRAVTLASSQGSRPSKEFEKAQHGYFTYYTLLGLKGKADANNDGWVTTTELYNYVKKNVSDATNEVQVPVLKGAREIRLGRVR